METRKRKSTLAISIPPSPKSKDTKSSDIPGDEEIKNKKQNSIVKQTGPFRNEKSNYKNYKKTMLASSLFHPLDSTKSQLFTFNDQPYVLISYIDNFTLVSAETGRHVRTIVIPQSYELLSICYSQNSVWVGCKTLNKIGLILEYKMEDLFVNDYNIMTKKQQKSRFTSWTLPKDFLLSNNGIQSSNEDGHIDDESNKSQNLEKNLQNLRVKISHITAPHAQYLQNQSESQTRFLHLTFYFTQNQTKYATFKYIAIPELGDQTQSMAGNIQVVQNMGVINNAAINDIKSIHPLPSGNLLIVQNKCLYFVCMETGFKTKVTLTRFTEKYFNRKQRKATKGGDLITCVDISPDGKDIAIGFSNGRIRIFVNFFDQLKSEDNDAMNESKIVRKLADFQHRLLHWHQHAVLDVKYLNPNLLLSGGKEAVLISWQLGYTTSGGGTMTTAPIHTLPRLFRGSSGITSIATHDSSRILVAGKGENSLKMISAHDYRRIWQIGGLSYNPLNGKTYEDEIQIRPEIFVNKHTQTLSSLSNYGGDKHSPIIQICPITSDPVLVGLNGSPGFIHKLSSSTSQSRSKIGFHTLSSTLEVVPYNRVSRYDANDLKVASLIPRVSHFAFSSNGNVLVTVDNTLSELETLGRQVIANNGIISESTTLKFWTRSETPMNGTRMPYTLNSVVTNPHGHAQNISGIVLNDKGTRLVTISSTENAFRLWTFNLDKDLENHEGGWKCKYKISTPSSFSSYAISGAMSFNPVPKDDDESVLAIAYGNNIALWDVSVDREYPILLRTLFHSVDPPSNTFENDTLIENIIFSNSHGGERIISISRDSICAQSIFPGVSTGWRYVTNGVKSKKIVKIAAVEYIKAQRAIAVAYSKGDNWMIQLLDEDEGTPFRSLGRAGKGRHNVESMCADPSGNCLYLVTNKSELYSLSLVDEKYESQSFVGNLYDFSTAPKLDIPSSVHENRTKRAKLIPTTIDQGRSNNEPWSMDVDSSELPTLGGSFFKNILGSKLKKATALDDEGGKSSDTNHDVSDEDSDEELDLQSNDHSDTDDANDD